MVEGKDWPQKRRVTVIGAVLNLALSIGKVAGGVVGQSQALIADGVHSLSDLASDGLVLLAARFGSREADHNHPYGHQRIETLATLGVGLVLLAIGMAFLVDSATRLLEPARQLDPGWSHGDAAQQVLARRVHNGSDGGEHRARAGQEGARMARVGAQQRM